MKQSAKRMVSSVAALLFLVGAFVVFANYVEPAYVDISDVNARIIAQEGFYREQKAVLDNVKKATGSYDQGAGAREQISYVLPAKPDVASALLQIGGIAHNNGVGLRAVTATILPPAPQAKTADDSRKKIVTEKPISTVMIRAELSGSYEDFKGFLRNLETNIRIFDVKSMTLQHVGKPNQNSYNYSVTVAAYYQE